MNKKLIFLLLSLLAMTACHNDDEPNGEEYFQNLFECPTNGIYEGVISDFTSSVDRIGVWCVITKQPDDLIVDSIAPTEGSMLYINRNLFQESSSEIGKAIKFQIIEFDRFPPHDFPYFYLLLMDSQYFIGNVRLIND